MVALIDQLKGEYGARSRGRVLEMLLQDLLDPGDAASDPEADPLKDDAEPAVATRPDEVTSLVLISTGNQQQGGEDAPTSASGLPSGGGSSGIDLPGFVSKRTSQLKATLRSSAATRFPVERPPCLNGGPHRSKRGQCCRRRALEVPLWLTTGPNSD